MVTPLLLSLFLTVPADTTVAGKWTLRACKGPCGETDSAAFVAWGTVILTADGSACFDLTVVPGHRSYLALVRGGLTTWERTAPEAMVKFRTYRSPDAGHEIVLLRSDSGLVGRGRSWGAGAAEIDVPDEYVAGRRVGPADIRRCNTYRVVRRARWLSPLIFVAAAVGLTVLGRHGS
jgi:hypothetical protein